MLSPQTTGNLQEQEDAAYRLTLQRTIDSLNSDVMELQKRTQEAEASNEHMAKEHTEKLQEMNEATAQAQVACDKLDDAELRATQAGTSVDKAHQVCASFSEHLAGRMLPAPMEAVQLPHPERPAFVHHPSCFLLSCKVP